MKASTKTFAKVRIGFVGVGNMGQCAHLKNYVALPGCEVVAIAELDQDRARKVAARYGVPRVYPEHEKMLAVEKLDGIVASQPFIRHGLLIPELLRAGVPIFTEKPLAGSLEVGQKVAKAVRKSGTWMMVGYHKRSDPATAFAREEIARLKRTGELGKMKYVRVTMPAGDWVSGGFTDLIPAAPPAGKGKAAPQPRWDPPAPDMTKAQYDEYVTFVNYYIHQVNLMRYLMGEPYEVKFADAPGVVLLAESRGGVTGLIEMTPYRTTIDWQESALVCFEKGYVKLELPAPLATHRPGRVEMLRDPGDGAVPQTVVPQLPWIHAMRQQAMNFVRAIRGEIKPPCDSEEALEDLHIAREYMRLWKGF
jgi:predicted dehydrogenase